MGLFSRLLGRQRGSDPAQRDLDRLLPRITRVRVLTLHPNLPVPFSFYPGSLLDPRTLSVSECTMILDTAGETLLVTEDAVALENFRKTLQIVEDPKTFGLCSCHGSPVLELYAGQKLIATIGMQHGRALRWDRWTCDAELCNGQSLNDWLTTYGVEPTLLNVLLHTRIVPLPNVRPTCDYVRGGLPELKAAHAAYERTSAAKQRARKEQDAEDTREDVEARKRGMICPKCGFSHGWDGVHCRHCRYSSE